MVEFALALPVLLMVVYGLLESGRLLFIYASVVTASRQAARYGSATGLTPANLRYYQDCDGIRAAAKKVAFINRIDDSNIVITYDHGLDGSGNPVSFSGNFPACWPASLTVSNGDRIRVQVSSHWSPIIRIVPSWTGFDIVSQSNRTLLVGASIALDATQQGFTPSGALVLGKTASPEQYSWVGDVITYTYTLTNPGSDVVTGPFTIADDKIGSFNCNIASLPPGNGTGQCQRTYTITQADITAASVTNTAIATGGGLSAQAAATVTLLAQPKLSLTKLGIPPDIIVNNAIIRYTYTIKNEGNVPLTAPFAINDDKIRANSIDCSGVPSPLAIGATGTCTASYTISNQDIGNGSITNTATATATYNGQTYTSPSATFTVLTPPLVLTVTASPTSVTAAGQVVTFTYTLRNPGGNPISAPYSITNTKAGITLNCGGLTSPLGSGASTSCTGTYTVTQADMDAGSITNSVTATAKDGNKTINSNTANVMVTITQSPQLTLTKTPSVNTATVVGTTITYTYTLKNTGNVTLAAAYTVLDDKIVKVDCSGATGTLAPNQAKTCTATYTTVQADLDEGSIVNHATASGKFGTQTVTSSQTSAIVITYTGPRVRLQKTANPPTMSNVAGQVITYTYLLKNTGGVNLSNFAVTDNKISNVNCGGAAASLAPGATTTCTGTYTTTPADVSAGGVTNTATATAHHSGGTIQSNTATVTVAVYVCSGTTFTYGPVSAGQTVTWSINNSSGTDVRVSSISIVWSNGQTSALTQVRLGGNVIWSGTNNSGNFTVPGQSWTIPPGATNLTVQFDVPATDIRGTVTVTDVGCPN